MKQVLLVFIGGGVGSVLRYLINNVVNNTSGNFPLSTFLINVLGSLIIGIVLGLALKNDSLSSNQTLLLATGFCGGFTTFSAFAYENQVLLKSGDFTSFVLYTLSSVIIAILAVFLGLFLSKSL